MLVRVWEYDVVETSEQDFEQAYGAEGDWARLFAMSEGYLGTELFVSVQKPKRYLTVDRFSSTEAWRRFLTDHQDSYEALDTQSARLTRNEREVLATEVDQP